MAGEYPDITNDKPNSKEAIQNNLVPFHTNIGPVDTTHHIPYTSITILKVCLRRE